VSDQTGFASVESETEGCSRFVRQVREEVVSRSPYDAVQHRLDRIFTAIEAFAQEEL
jgi:hypothetical protein